MTAELIRWRGGPGAGKSTTLIEYVRSEVDAGTKIGDIVVMTFSRSQAADLASRLHDAVFPDAPAKEVLRLCATIHGMALRACMTAGLIEDPRQQVIQPGDRRKAPIYQAFMNERGLEYDPLLGTDEDEDRSRADLPTGNALITLNAYLQATLCGPEEWRKAVADLGLGVSNLVGSVEDLLRAWAAYKAERGLFEHEDYVRLALDHELPPPAPALFVDEYQDVSPAQNALIEQWINHPDTRRVYVAGDEDQSIYGFRGCDPSLFLSLAAEDRGARPDGSRPTSHRCPARIMETAETILGHPANVSPCSRKGQVHHVRPGNAETLARQVEVAVKYARTKEERQPVFVLSRFRKGAGSLARALSAAGVPCGDIKPGRVRFWTSARIGRSRDSLEPTTISPWTLKTAIARYLAGCDIDPIPANEAEALALAALVGKKRSAALTDLRIKANQGPVRLGDVYAWTDGRQGDRIFDRLNMRPWLVRQIRACLAREARRGYEITPEMVKVDTIHAAKGLEAAVVLLHTGYLKGRLDDLRMPDRRAEERRVYFVSATRASHALLLLDYGEGPVCPILEGVGA
ncbi:UvrD-helicase domain-containing protein [Methanofollis ethanolicus]|uniref:UvrD-helicase domain-containing protein n=1 Tax=Methanofollis ethanolicus TaxID=488124 RepID=UPI00082F4746|nr:ATP-dependent helicase [Methanofollis ethanolicus]